MFLCPVALPPDALESTQALVGRSGQLRDEKQKVQSELAQLLPSANPVNISFLLLHTLPLWILTLL